MRPRALLEPDVEQMKQTHLLLCSNHEWATVGQKSRNVQRSRGGLVFKAHRLLYSSTLGLRVTKRKKNRGRPSRFVKSKCAAAHPNIFKVVTFIQSLLLFSPKAGLFWFERAIFLWTT